MPRQKKDRYCELELRETIFKPRGLSIEQLEAIELELDELEAVYLCDFLDNDQTQAAELMGVSRGTIQRLLYSARHKLVDLIVNCKSLQVITGDHIIPPCPDGLKGKDRHDDCRNYCHRGHHRRGRMENTDSSGEHPGRGGGRGRGQGGGRGRGPGRESRP